MNRADQHRARPALAGIAEGEPGASDALIALLRKQVAQTSGPLSGSTVSRY